MQIMGSCTVLGSSYRMTSCPSTLRQQACGLCHVIPRYPYTKPHAQQLVLPEEFNNSWQKLGRAFSIRGSQPLSHNKTVFMYICSGLLIEINENKCLTSLNDGCRRVGKCCCHGYLVSLRTGRSFTVPDTWTLFTFWCFWVMLHL